MLPSLLFVVLVLTLSSEVYLVKSDSSTQSMIPSAYTGKTVEKYHTMPHSCPPPLVNQSRYYCPGSSNDTNIELIGFLPSFSIAQNGVGTFIAGAIPLAVEDVNRSVSPQFACNTFDVDPAVTFLQSFFC